jgi:hypothetical protein
VPWIGIYIFYENGLGRGVRISTNTANFAGRDRNELAGGLSTEWAKQEDVFGVGLGLVGKPRMREEVLVDVET